MSDAKNNPPPDARTVVPGQAVTYHANRGQIPGLLRELAKATEPRPAKPDGATGQLSATDKIAEDVACDELRVALQGVPRGGASGDAPAWLIRLHRAACEVAGIGVRESTGPVAPSIRINPIDPVFAQRLAAALATPEGEQAARDALARSATEIRDRNGRFRTAFDSDVGEFASPPGDDIELPPFDATQFRESPGTREPPGEHPSESTCSCCGDRLYFSDRARGDSLCGPHHRAATGTQTLADRCRAAGIEPSLILEILASPEGRAAIAECMSRPPVRQPDGTWREPEPGSEAKPGDWVRRTGGALMESATWRRVGRIDGDIVSVADGSWRWAKWPLAETELVQQAEGRAWPVRTKRDKDMP